MALALQQRGTGRALVIFAGPAGLGDHTTAPGLPAASRAALGPAPWIVCVNGLGPESLSQILGFARVHRTDLWLAAVIAFSAGGQKWRQLCLEGLSLTEPGALAWVAIDAMHSQMPPLPLHVQLARDLAAQARVGALTFVLGHTYIQPAPYLDKATGRKVPITSTVDMARLATGWELSRPPLGQTVARREYPPVNPRAWDGGLAVYSTGSGPADTAAHIWQAGTLMPYVLGRHVRSLVELDTRPDVQRSEVVDPNASSPEPGPVQLDIGSPSSTATASKQGPKPGPTAPAVFNAPKVTAVNAVLLIGDSLALGLAQPMQERARATPVNFASTGQQSTTIHQWVTGQGLGKPLSAVLEEAQPSLTLVSLGTNDMRTSDPAAAGREGGQLADLLLRSGAGAVGWILPPAMPFGDGGFRAALAAELAQRNVRTFDSSALAIPRASDGIHPTAAGYALWARGIADWWPFSLLGAGAFPAPPIEAPTPAPALVALLAQIDAQWPTRGRASDGIGGDAEHQQRQSDHNTGDALDITADPANGPPLDVLAAALLRDPRTHYVIWNRRIANPEKAGGAWRPYTGASPHTDHLHLSIYPEKRNDGSAWNLSSSAPAPAPTSDNTVYVQGYGAMKIDPDYVARVLTGENGAAKEVEGLKALAIAVRTYVRGAMKSVPGLGSPKNPLRSDEYFQVCAPTARPLCLRAAQETQGGVALYRGKFISANHVAGAPWPTGQKRGEGPGLGGTERDVTYNEGKHGADVTPSPIGFGKNPQNRGCMSQNGAEALAAQGYFFGDICRFFYGDDVELTIAEYRVPGPGPAPGPGPGPGPAPTPAPPAPTPAPRPPASPREPPSGGGNGVAVIALGLALVRALA